jgi:ribosomal-protein-alanine N-acetyltransferase
MFQELYRRCPRLFFVARRSGRIVGYAITRTDSRSAEMISIAVDPAHRRSGLGTALMDRTIRKLKRLGVRKLELAVKADNRPAVRFYRGFGFAIVKRIARYYEDRSDALWMRRILKTRP